VTLQDFSSVVGPNTFFYGSWEATGDVSGTLNKNSQFVQGAGVFDITGASAIIPTNSSASKLEFFNVPRVSIGTNTLLSVTAQALANNAATSFEISLKDAGGKSASVSFNATSFPTGSYTTAIGVLTFDSGFLSSSIDSMIISGAQPVGTAVFNFSFDNVSAVPEPATYAGILGAGAFGLVLVRRRRRKS
jgi:hypothetical protein